jgi:Asp-tRNA(Asn)/Glu-tRNA(Gln) amidotransferase A subunit family amidase
MSTLQSIAFHSSVAAFLAGSDTPSAYLARCLETIERLEPGIGAFVTLNIPGAVEAAAQSTRRWREGRPLSSIDGMPLGIKDIIETADMPTQMGSDLYAGWRSERDAASVCALREAGAIVLGKTVTTEFAASPPRGTRNPWDPRRTPGGSSSGSAAAVAAGMIPLALGTQGIGSILRPASYCGCIGYKPTFGAINRGGSHDGLSQSTHGALAATLEDAWIVLREIVERIGGDPGCYGLMGPSEPPAPQKPQCLAVLRTAGWGEAQNSAKSAFAMQIGRLRGEGINIIDADNHASIAALEQCLAAALPISLRINTWEMRWPLNTYRNRDAAKISPLLLDRLRDAEDMTVADYRSLLAQRGRAGEQWHKLAAEIDGAIALAAPGVAPIGLNSTGNAVFAVVGSYLHSPAVSLPLLSVGGLPVGLQIVGFRNRDADLIAIARWISATLAPVVV